MNIDSSFYHNVLISCSCQSQVDDKYLHLVDRAIGRQEDPNTIETVESIPKGKITYLLKLYPDGRSIELELEHLLDHVREEAAHYLTGARLLVANIAAW